MTSGIYQIRNLVNDKVYVGQTKNFVYRRSRHFRSLQDGIHYNKYLQRSFNKHGLNNFSFEVLERCAEGLLNERERYWIEEKQSEYSDKGYNSVYAVNLFEKYDKNRRVNKTKRKHNKIIYTDEVRKKFQASIARYWENEDNRIKHSLASSNIDYETIVRIKTLLKKDLEIASDDIAKRYGVSVNSVNHIINMASHDYVLSEYNYVIKNRKVILDKRKNKTVIRMYRDGCSYQEIGTVVGLHHRNVIRRVNAIKTIHDDRCRLNVIKRASRKKTSLVRTLHSMGYNDIQSSRLLNASRSYIWNIRTGSLLKDYEDVNQVRAKVKPFNYKIGKVKTDELIIERVQGLVKS